MFARTIAFVAAGIAIVGFTAASAEAGDAAKYKVIDENSIPKSLTGKPGEAANGRKVAINRKKGNCLACHKMPIPEQQFHGEVGPDLAGVGSRYSVGEIRLRVVNPKILNEATIMPSFYRTDGYHRVLKNFKGKSIISAQEVEDIVAYLVTLKEKN